MTITAEQLSALELARDLAPTPKEVRRVADRTSPEAAAWAFTQWDLRKRGEQKFREARNMLFVREALEQASHERVAAYHASRFPVGVLVADLTSGIGADLLALARRGPAVGFETDGQRAEISRFNLDVSGLAGEVRVQDSLQADWNFEYAFADPSRRAEGRRTLEVSEFSPNPFELSRRMSGLELGGIKLSPLLSDDVLESLGAGLEFVSFCGECREALVWTGKNAASGRFAVHVESGMRLQATMSPTAVGEPLQFFFEANPAAIRAHSLGTLCREFGLYPLAGSNGYLTGPADEHSEWFKSYRVLYHGKGDIATTRKVLDRIGGGVPVIKLRAAGEKVEVLRKKLTCDGDREVVIAVWAVGKSLKHTILEPV